MNPAQRDDSDLPDLEPLLKRLRALMAASKGTTREISTVSIAADVGISQGHVSKLLRGRRSLRGTRVEVLRKILACFPLEPLEIEGILEHYKLGEPGGAPRGKVAIMHEGSVSRPRGRAPAEVDEAHVAGFDVKHLRVREVADSDLATAAARVQAPVGTELLVHSAASPVDGSLVIVEVPKYQVLVEWPIRENEFALPYSADSRRMPVPVPADAVIVGVVARVTRSYPLSVDD